MAAFNPEVPSTNPQSFMGYSRPIQGYQGNQAGGTLLKGIGTDIDEFSKDANLAVKQNIGDEVDVGLNKIRDDYRNRLQATYNDISGEAMDVLPKDPTNTGGPPPDLSNRITNRLATLQAARQSGKYSDTHLDMEYDDFLKETRSKYPGYRDWIDETAAKSMGRGDTANNVIRGLMGDLNSYAAKAQKNRNDVDTKIGQSAAAGDPESIAAYQNRNNLSTEEKTGLINRKDVQSSKIASLQQTRDNAGPDAGLRTSAAFAEANQRVSDSLSNFIHTFTMGGATTDKIISEIQDTKTSPEQKANDFATLSHAMQIFRSRQVMEFNKVNPNTGRSLDMDLGGKSQEIIDSQMSFYNSFQDWMKNNQGGPVAAVTNYVKAMDKAPISDIMKASIGQYTGTINNIIKDNPNGNQYLVNVQKDANNINPSIKAAADARRFELAAGKPTTINQTIQDAKNEDLPTKVGDANARGFYNSVVNWHKDIFDKSNPAVQHNMATAMFGPGNEGVLKHFPTDTNTTRGQSTVFNQWFSPAMDKTMFTDIAKKDGNLLSSYSVLKKNEFTQSVLPGEIKNLNNYQNLDKVKWSYDNETHQLGVHGDQTPELRQAQIAVNRLNTSLVSMQSLAKFTREDPNALITHALATAGIPDGPAAKAIMKSVKSSFSARDRKDKESGKSFAEFP